MAVLLLHQKGGGNPSEGECGKKEVWPPCANLLISDDTRYCIKPSIYIVIWTANETKSLHMPFQLYNQC